MISKITASLLSNTRDIQLLHKTVNVTTKTFFFNIIEYILLSLNQKQKQIFISGRD